jgi:hypothetical protein
MKCAIDDEKKVNKICQFEVEKLRAIIEHNQKTKDKWKNLILEIAKRLEAKIVELLQENHRLKTTRR